MSLVVLVQLLLEKVYHEECLFPAADMQRCQQRTWWTCLQRCSQDGRRPALLTTCWAGVVFSHDFT